jgi:2-phospho-L-lactate guanylyltransferase
VVPPVAADRARFAVVVPVKRTALAKSRLAVLGEEPRRRLATAFALDTVAAVLSCQLVGRVLVVTDDHELAVPLRGLGAEVVPDGASGLNESLVQAAAEMHRRQEAVQLAVVCSDVPALRPEELALALDAADPAGMSFVADEQRVGTTALMAPTLADFRPTFGNGSRQEHLASGAFEVGGVDVPGLRRDVDDPQDLTAALRLGVGVQTSCVAADLGL